MYCIHWFEPRRKRDIIQIHFFIVSPVDLEAHNIQYSKAQSKPSQSTDTQCAEHFILTTTEPQSFKYLALPSKTNHFHVTKIKHSVCSTKLSQMP